MQTKAMDSEIKKALLIQIYRIYASVSDSMETACKLHCSLCCTRNVTMTTLEGFIVADYLVTNGKTFLFDRIRSDIEKSRLRPEITTNRLAELCVEGKHIPEENSDNKGGACPLLENDECTIYPVRPFGCRCFVSKSNCHSSGVADIDPFLLTVNNLFLQYIEHIDADGCFGNLTDILITIESEGFLDPHKLNRLQNTETGLVANRPVKHLLVPPEHRSRIEPLLSRIAQELNN